MVRPIERKRLTSVPLRAFPLSPRAPPCSRNTMEATQEILNCLEATLNKEKETSKIDSNDMLHLTQYI